MKVVEKVKGNADKGEVYFNTVCAGCHGLDGKKLKDFPIAGTVSVYLDDVSLTLGSGEVRTGQDLRQSVDDALAVRSLINGLQPSLLELEKQLREQEKTK